MRRRRWPTSPSLMAAVADECRTGAALAGGVAALPRSRSVSDGSWYGSDGTGVVHNDGGTAVVSASASAVAVAVPLRPLSAATGWHSPGALPETIAGASAPRGPPLPLLLPWALPSLLARQLRRVFPPPRVCGGAVLLAASVVPSALVATVVLGAAATAAVPVRPSTPCHGVWSCRPAVAGDPPPTPCRPAAPPHLHPSSSSRHPFVSPGSLLVLPPLPGAARTHSQAPPPSPCPPTQPCDPPPCATCGTPSI